MARRRLQALFSRFAQGDRARFGSWPVRAFGPRFGPDPDPAAAGGVNLEDAAVKAEIARQVKARTEALEQEKTRHATGKQEAEKARDELIAKLGGKSIDDVLAAAAQLEEVRTKQKAGEHGVDPDKYKADVEAAAQAKFTVWKGEQEGIHKKASERVTELETENQRLKGERHRMFVARELALAAVPPEARIVHESAYDYLLDTVAPFVVEHLPTGAKLPIARFKVGETLAAGAGEDGYMTRDEFLSLLRSGKGPVPGVDLSFAFVSKGQGSATTTPTQTTSTTGAKKWEDMTDAERDKFVNEHSKDEVHAAIADMRQRAREAKDREKKKSVA